MMNYHRNIRVILTGEGGLSSEPGVCSDLVLCFLDTII